MQIGPYRIEPNVILAPMAGVTDKPFRLLSKRLGAGLAVSEMTTSDPRFWNTAKSLHRMDHIGEPDPVSVQIAGTVPEVMAEAAKRARLERIVRALLAGRLQPTCSSGTSVVQCPLISLRLRACKGWLPPTEPATALGLRK